MKVAFFGLPLAGCLLAADGHSLCLAVLSPVAAPGGRRLRRQIGAGRVRSAPKTPGEHAEIERRLRAEQPDLIVSWFWTRRLPEGWLETARLGAIGAHPSLLPRHRGPDPYFWAIDSGDVETGVTVPVLEGEYDTGDIVLQESLPIGEQTAWQLARALDRPSLRLLRRAARQVAEQGAVRGTPQPPGDVTWAPAPDGALLRVDWSWPTARILRRIRALSPTPGLALEVAGLRMEVTHAVDTSDYPLALKPGEAAALGRRLVIRSGDGALEVVWAMVEESARDEPRRVSGNDLAALVASRQPVLDSASSEDPE